MKFKHLNIPSHWQQYYTKYPEGYTILEALFNWIEQVNDMVDNQNKLSEKVTAFRNEIDDFVERFDPRLQEEVIKTLSEWQESGFLDVVIDEALQTKMHDLDDKLNKRGVYVTDPPFNAIGDGITDNTLAFIEASEHARDNGLQLVIPQGEYYISDNVVFYTDVICYGTILSDASIDDYLIRVEREEPYIEKNAIGLSGFGRDSTKINGLVGYNGYTLRVQSNELLMNRFSQANEIYRKFETVKVISDGGDISPSLDQDYIAPEDSGFKVLLFPPSQPIEITGLNIRLVGEGVRNRVVIYNDRSNVTYNNVTIDNKNVNSIVSTYISVANSTDIEFNELTISGTYQSGDTFTNYGVSVTHSAFVTFTNCHIHNTRHSISGRYAKQIHVRGGSFSQQIDHHWCDGMIIEGAVISANRTQAISYAGSNLTVRNCEIKGNFFVAVGVRMDTPELRGKLIVEDITINTVASYLRIVSAGSVSGIDFDYGVEVVNPVYTRIRDIVVELPPTSRLGIVELGIERNYSQTGWGDIHISDITTINSNDIVGLYFEQNTTYYNYLYPTRVFMKNIDFIYNEDGSNQTMSLRLYETGTPTSPNFEVYFDNCTNIAFKSDDSIIDKMISRESRFSGYIFYNNETTAFGEYWYYNCLIKDVRFISNTPNNFFSCVFSGVNSTTADKTLDDKVNISMNNVATVGINPAGYPTLTNKVNEDIYFT